MILESSKIAIASSDATSIMLWPQCAMKSHEPLLRLLMRRWAAQRYVIHIRKRMINFWQLSSIIYRGSGGFHLHFRYIFHFLVHSNIELHSPSKCLAWIKKCHHVWLDQNFDPSLLTNKLWLIFMGKKQKKNFFSKKKNSKWPTQKNNVFQNRQFSKIFCEINIKFIG